MTINEISDLLGISQKQLRKLVAAGYIQCTVNGTSYSITNEELERVKPKILDGSLIRATKTTSQDARFGNVKQTPFHRQVNWVDVTREWDNPTNTNLTFVDLFCGAGGLSKGFELAGLHGICGLDWFAEAGETYRRNFNHPFVKGDIKSPEVKKTFY